MIDKKVFFDKARPLFGGKLTKLQVEGMIAIIDEWTSRQLIDIRWLAYMMATVFHETSKKMQPIEEYGRGKGYDYGKHLKMSRKPYSTPDKIFFGRGLVQLTWYENYSSMGKLLKIDLLNNPELVLQMDVSVKIMFEGMTRGFFTGKKLSHYFNDTISFPGPARRIINGTDKAELIAGYYSIFLSAFKN